MSRVRCASRRLPPCFRVLNPWEDFDGDVFGRCLSDPSVTVAVMGYAQLLAACKHSSLPKSNPAQRAALGPGQRRKAGCREREGIWQFRLPARGAVLVMDGGVGL